VAGSKDPPPESGIGERLCPAGGGGTGAPWGKLRALNASIRGEVGAASKAAERAVRDACAARAVAVLVQPGAPSALPPSAGWELGTRETRATPPFGL